MILSIITINLNNEAGLEKTLNSVFFQTFTDFEYIVVDGKSDDGSVDLLKKYENSSLFSYSWFSEADSGVYQAMNKGINKAKGEYLLFLNSGDFLVDKDVIGNVFKNEHNADILCGKCNVSKDSKIIWTSDPPEYITFGTIFKEGLAHQSTFISKRLFEKYGLYREDFKYNSDIDFWYRTIIINKVSTEKLSFVITDYNLDGISSKENTSKKYQEEMSIILSQSNFEKFIPDYQTWIIEKKSMEMYYWAKSNKLVDGIIRFIYKLAILIRNKKTR